MKWCYEWKFSKEKYKYREKQKAKICLVEKVWTKNLQKCFRRKKVRTKKLQKRFIKQKWSGRFLLRNLYKKEGDEIEKNEMLDRKSNPKA